MKINRKTFEPYYDIIDGPSSHRKELNLTNREKRELKKIEKKEKHLKENLPKRNDFKTEVRKAVKDIKSCNQYLTNQLIKKEYTKSLSYTGIYEEVKNKSLFNFYANFIGAIDAQLDAVESSIYFEKSFNRSNVKSNMKKMELLTFREKVVNGYNEEIEEKLRKKSTYNLLLDAIREYPSYLMISTLYEKIKKGDSKAIIDIIMDFTIAYSQGYQNGSYLTTEELKTEYAKGILELKVDKEINQEEINKVKAKIRK